MEEHVIKYEQTYQQFKSELSYELNKAANSFIRIGYLLKVARDSEILKDSPYSSYLEFAREEFHIDESQVSRFIGIQERFCKTDDPEQLKDEYQGYGVAKLGIMLTLPDHVNEELSPDMSKAEIKAVADEVKEEAKITPIERMAEETNGSRTLLEDVMYTIGEDDAELMAKLLKEEGFTLKPDPVKEIRLLAPAGQKLYMVRIPGTGRVTLNIKNGEAILTKVADGDKETYKAADISKALEGLINNAMEGNDDDIKDEKEMWTLIYDKPFITPLVKNAPVQEKKVSITKPEPKKTDAKKPKKEPKPAKEALREEIEEPEAEPEEKNEEPHEDEYKEPEKPKMDKNTMRGYKAGLTADINTLQRLNRDNNYRAMRTKLQSMLQVVSRIIEEE